MTVFAFAELGYFRSSIARCGGLRPPIRWTKSPCKRTSGSTRPSRPVIWSRTRAREEEKAPAKFAGAAMMLTNFDGCLLASVGAVDGAADIRESVVNGWADNV